MSSRRHETVKSAPPPVVLPADSSLEAGYLGLTTLVALLAAQAGAIMLVRMPPERLTIVLAAAVIPAALHAYHSEKTARHPPWLTLGVLAAEALAVYVPLVALGVTWPGMGGFLVASLLVVVPGRAGWVLAAAVIASLFATATALNLGVREAADLTVAGLAVGLIMFGVHRLVAAIRQIRGMQAEVTQLAVIRERVRFSRDLHDLLSYNLAAIELRAELSRRLMTSDPVTASDELRDVIDIARQAVAEVRQVADGYRNLSLSQETADAAALLASADAVAKVEINCGTLPEKIDSVLAMVLRQLVANVLRHSKARNCRITVERTGGHVTLSVTNDGVSSSAVTHRDRGGLENLASRLEAVGGELTATTTGNGQFHVLAKIAVGEEPASALRDFRRGGILS